MVDGHSHYFNILDNGEEVDLTWEQFRVGATKSDRQLRERSYVLSFPDAARRYVLLRTAVDRRWLGDFVADPRLARVTSIGRTGQA